MSEKSINMAMKEKKEVMLDWCELLSIVTYIIHDQRCLLELASA